MDNLQVVVSGGYRTGSTFIYISVLEIFKYLFNDFTFGIKGNIELKNNKDKRPAVFKSHDYFPGDKKYKIIHTIRNPFDILSSLKKCRPALPDYMAEVKNIVLRDRYFKHNNDILILKYEDFFGNEGLAIDSILDFLKIEYPELEKKWLTNKQNYKNVKAVTDLLEIGNPTPYTAFHISDNPEPGNFINYLDEDEISELKEFLKDLKTQ